MKKTVSLWLCLLWLAVLPFEALAEGLEIEYDQVAGAAIMAVEDEPDIWGDILSGAVEPAVPEAEEALLPEGGHATTEADSDSEGETAVSAEESVAIDELNFPDAQFRKYVRENYDMDGDGALSEEEREAVGHIWVDGMGIGSLKGIEWFQNLTLLSCPNNKLTNLDVCQNIGLWELNCNNNRLTNLDVSKNTALFGLYCDSNQLTSLDVSYNPALASLNCVSNQLTKLDLSKNNALGWLHCSYNQLTELDVSHNPALYELCCYLNRLKYLNIKGCTALETLSCESNQLTSLDVSGCSLLNYLECYENRLTSLNLNGCTALETLSCESNQLTSLDVSGCNALKFLNCDSNQLTSLDVSGCTALKVLDCRKNQLSSLDVSGCTALESLSCFVNQLTSLDVSRNVALEVLDCSNNQLTNLDVSRNTGLSSLTCDDNQLTNLDVCQNIGLGALDCNNNRLTNLDVSKNTALSRLYCDSNQLTSLDVSNNAALYWLTCESNPLTRLDISHNTALKVLTCNDTQISKLDLTQCKYMKNAVKKGEKVDYDDRTMQFSYRGDEVYLRINSTTELTVNGKVVYGGKPVSLANATVTVKAQTYTGKALKPEVKVTLEGAELISGTDYKVTYENNKELGTAIVTVTGKGRYFDSKKATFRILPIGLSEASVAVKNPAYTWTGAALTPAPTVRMNEKKLKVERDYTVSYGDNVDLGTATVTVTGAGNYTGTATTTFTVAPRPVKSCRIAYIPGRNYTGKAIVPAPKVTYKGKAMKAGTDYTVSYRDNVNAGTATVTVTGKGVYAGTKEKTFTVKRMSITACTFPTLKDRTYTGKAIKPTPAVKSGSKKLKAGTDYEVTYENNVNVGKAVVTISGKGNYKGTKRLSFTILPKGVSLVSLKAGAGTLQAKWKKGGNIDGYQLQYGQKKDFTDAKSATVSGVNTLSSVVKKLESGKTYYVRIRTYKTVNGKKYWSAWSKALTKKVK